MPTQDELNKMADETALLWIDETTDVRHMSKEAQKKAGYKAPKTTDESWEDEWGGVIRPNKNMTVSDIEADEETLNELARRDPKFRAKLDDVRMEEVVDAFKKANPDYIASERNYEVIVRYIRDRQLKDSNCPLDDVDDVAYAEGLWTVANLSAVFKYLAAKGKLEMPAGKPKELSREEKLSVIANIRQGDPQAAVVNFITYSFAGRPPREFSSAHDFMTAYPDLTSKAVWFVFEQIHAGELSIQELADFKKAMSRHALPTVPFLQDALIRWHATANLRSPAAPEQAVKDDPAPEPTQRELESLSDAEIDARIIEQQKEWRRSQYL
jgi:hypothetical protein